MTHTAYYILPLETGHLLLAVELERTLKFYLQRRQIACNTRSFYDEFADDGTEYGVRIDVQGLSPDQWRQLLTETAWLCRELYGDVRVDQG